MSSLLLGIGSIFLILFVVTFIVVAIVKLVMYLIGKPITTPNKRTRKLLFFEIAIILGSFLVHLLNHLFGLISSMIYERFRYTYFSNSLKGIRSKTITPELRYGYWSCFWHGED